MLTATKRLLAEVVNRSRTGKKGPYAAYYVHVQPGASFVGELDAISAPDHKHAGHPFFAMQLVFMGVNYIFPVLSPLVVPSCVGDVEDTSLSLFALPQNRDKLLRAAGQILPRRVPPYPSYYILTIFLFSF